MRKCPNDSTEMTTETVGGIELAVCPTCGGTWFPRDTLHEVLDGQVDVLKELEVRPLPGLQQKFLDKSTMFCPDDTTLLDRYHYLYNSPVILHACPTCGGCYVAEGDLAQIEQWREKSHQPGPEDDVATALAMATVEHQKEMARSQNVMDLMNAFRTYVPGWWGLV